MRADENPLDLNNLPDDNNNSKDHQLLPADTISSPPAVTGSKEKEDDDDDDDDDDRKDGKVYECRFCSLKFCKSQALGGHMNRHRQEKETEKLNNARQLLLRNDHNLVAQAALHLGCYPAIATAGYHPHPTMPLRFPTTTSFSAPGSSSSTQQQYNLYPPPPSHFHHPNQQYGESSNYTCIGAPVVGQPGFPDSTRINRFQDHPHHHHHHGL